MQKRLKSPRRFCRAGREPKDPFCRIELAHDAFILGIAQLDPVRVKAYRDLESSNKLTMRIQGSWDFNTRYVTTTLEEQSKTFITRDKRGENSALINVDGVKVYLDGVPKDGEGGAPMISGRDALEVHRLIDAIEKSGARGQRVSLEDLADGP